MEERKEEPAVKRSYFFLRFWDKPSLDEKPADPSKLVVVDQLPVYSEDFPKFYTFVESSPLPMQESISKVRQSATDQYATLKDRFRNTDKFFQKTAQAVYSLNKQIREEWTTVPKAMAIIMGGMAGYILGIRRTFFRRWLYSASGLGTMAAFCYPNETVDVFRTAIAHGKMAWFNFKESPEPPSDSAFVPQETVKAILTPLQSENHHHVESISQEVNADVAVTSGISERS